MLKRVLVLAGVWVVLGAATASAASLSELEAKAAEGDVMALNRLGGSYMFGMDGFAVDQPKACTYYEKLSDMGISYHQRLFSLCYLNGWYVEKDMTKAEELALSSAKKGFKEGQFFLANSYAKGNFFTKNEVEGYYWGGRALQPTDDSVNVINEPEKGQIKKFIDDLRRVMSDGDKAVAEARLKDEGIPIP